ncbi:MAG: hypothetical protein WCP14_04745 [bacterium]
MTVEEYENIDSTEFEVSEKVATEELLEKNTLEVLAEELKKVSEPVDKEKTEISGTMQVQINPNDTNKTFISKIRNSTVLKVAALGIVLGGTTVATTGCSESGTPGVNFIEQANIEAKARATKTTALEITKNPSKFENKDVVIEGYPKVIFVHKELGPGPGGVVNIVEAYVEVYQNEDLTGDHIMVYEKSAGVLNFIIQPVEGGGWATAEKEKLSIFGNVQVRDGRMNKYLNGAYIVLSDASPVK